MMGGQDNVQDVAGQLPGFFSELGHQFPQFPCIAHSRGWSAEDAERNVPPVPHSEELRRGACELIHREVEFTRLVIEKTRRGGKDRTRRPQGPPPRHRNPVIFPRPVSAFRHPPGSGKLRDLPEGTCARA